MIPSGVSGVVVLLVRPRFGVDPSIRITPVCAGGPGSRIPGCTPRPPPGPELYGMNPPMAPLNGTYVELPPKYDPAAEKRELDIPPELGRGPKESAY
jgi:hypothetical protein